MYNTPWIQLLKVPRDTYFFNLMQKYPPGAGRHFRISANLARQNAYDEFHCEGCPVSPAIDGQIVQIYSG